MNLVELLLGKPKHNENVVSQMEMTTTTTAGSANVVWTTTQEFLEKARNHYCEICDQFYKSKGATTTHKKYAHKPKIEVQDEQ